MRKITLITLATISTVAYSADLYMERYHAASAQITACEKLPTRLARAEQTLKVAKENAINTPVYLGNVSHLIPLAQKTVDEVRIEIAKHPSCEDATVALRVAQTAYDDMSIRRDIEIQARRDQRAREQARQDALPGARIGMTTKQVLQHTSWGEPKDINRTTTKNGAHEQWVYENGNYLYFTNGKLTAIQN